MKEFGPDQQEELKAWTYANYSNGVVLVQARGVGWRKHWARCGHSFDVDKRWRVAATRRYCFQSEVEADTWAWQRPRRAHAVWCRTCEDEG